MTTRPTPKLAEPLTIDQWWKNRAGQAVKISLATFQDRNLIDVRTYSTVDGKLKATVKGFAADIKHLPRLTAAFAKAEAKARELHLIDDDDGADQ
jgi:hypothetical protein